MGTLAEPNHCFLRCLSLIDINIHIHAQLQIWTLSNYTVKNILMWCDCSLSVSPQRNLPKNDIFRIGSGSVAVNEITEIIFHLAKLIQTLE